MDPQQQCSFDIFTQFLINKRTKNTQENDQGLALNKKTRKETWYYRTSGESLIDKKNLGKNLPGEA